MASKTKPIRVRLEPEQVRKLEALTAANGKRRNISEAVRHAIDCLSDPYTAANNEGCCGEALELAGQEIGRV